MAKFAVALCILLVACGAQGAISDVINEVLTGLKDKIEEGKEKVDAAWQSVVSKLKSLISDATEASEAILAELEEKKAAAEAKYTDVSSCVSSSVNLTATAESILSDAISCGVDAVAELYTKYNDMTASLETASSLRQKVMAEAADCTDWNLVTALTCISDLYQSSNAELLASSIAVVADTAEFVAYANNLQDTLIACGFDSAVTNLQAAADAAWTEFNECLESLDSTSE